MYNLNVNLATSAANAVNSLLGVETGCTTPRTPEILNSLIAMTNPLDNYNFGDDAPKTATGPLGSASSDSNSSSCSQMESPTNSTPSIQHTCSQLIKAGLKLSIEQKRKHQSDGEDLLDLDKCKRIKKSECSESEEDRNNYHCGVRIILKKVCILALHQVCKRPVWRLYFLVFTLGTYALGILALHQVV